MGWTGGGVNKVCVEEKPKPKLTPTTKPKLISTVTTPLAFESANSHISKGTETNAAGADATLITIVIIITVGVLVGIVAVFILVIICVKVLRKKQKTVAPSLCHTRQRCQQW